MRRGAASPRIFLLALAVAGGIFLGDLVIPLGLGTPILYVIPIVLLGVWTPPAAMTAVFGMAGLCTLLTLAGFFLAPPGHADLAIGNRILALSAVWITVIITLLRKGAELDADRRPEARHHPHGGGLLQRYSVSLLLARIVHVSGVVTRRLRPLHGVRLPPSVRIDPSSVP